VLAAGDVATAAAWNVLVNNDINLRGLANVVQGTLTTATGIANSTTYVDTGLTVNITPTANTSKILITCSLSVGASASVVIGMRVMRDATAIGVGVAAGSRTVVGMSANIPGASNYIAPMSWSYLDSPATTSAVTYKVQLNVLDAGTVYINRSGADTDSSAFGRAQSSIIVREIPA
jgi:hypothetical protein